MDFTGTFGTSTQQILFTSTANMTITNNVLVGAIAGVPGTVGNSSTYNNINFATYDSNGTSSNTYGIGTFAAYVATSDINVPVATLPATATVQPAPCSAALHSPTRTLNALDFNAGSTTTLTWQRRFDAHALRRRGHGDQRHGGDDWGRSCAGARHRQRADCQCRLVADGQRNPQLFGLCGQEPGRQPDLQCSAILRNRELLFEVGGGTVTLNGGNNTLYEGTGVATTAASITSDPGSTLDINGTAQTISYLSGPGQGTLDGSGGTITSSAAGGTLVLNDRTAVYFSGQITGNLAFGYSTSVAGDYEVFTNNLSYNGSTTIAGGEIALYDQGQLSQTTSVAVNYGELLLTDNANNTLTNRVNTAATITLEGGLLQYNGRANTVSEESLGPVVIAQGLSVITVGAGGTNVNSADLMLASFSQTAGSGAMINITGSSLGLIGNAGRLGVTGSTTPTLVNNIIGGWAIVNGVDFASYIPYSFSSGTGVGGFAALGTAGYAAYDGTAIPTSSQPTQNIKLSSFAGVTLPSGGMNLNSLNLAATGTGALAFANSSDVLNLTAGGLLKSGGFANSFGTSTTSGVITAGGTASSGTQDLYITNTSSFTGSSALTIYSTIEDNPSGGRRPLGFGQYHHQHHLLGHDLAGCPQHLQRRHDHRWFDFG